MTSLAFSKGHGTQNDFVLLADVDAELDLTADLVRALADRRAGLGGDGVIRVVPTSAVPEGTAILAADPTARWFMDYRNADGSIAQMCGNGVRVFAAFLEHLGLADLSDGAPLAIGTRAGVRHVRREEVGYYAVGMGTWRLPGGTEAVELGADALVRTAGIADERPALSLDMGNPHTVVALADAAELAAADLTAAPVVTPVPPEGTNVEYVVALEADASVGHARMRVHERGVGETRSCGTGACAAAVAVRTWAGAGAPSTWFVDVPGGTVRVRLADDGTTELAGPARLVAHGTVDPAALVG
ncbi:diaminopimelate epimerase [Flavimobilis marinus]|uniref:Diaminopimelate epimerase n=1 Tax=Flavimobilis marinus TaxID=285351 RepID=A0A1I2E8U1_9MICO|nr:diaminopimelate epimerase [Flavimobilis marinus]GHG43473.1 diaminopimelate epimerase [Flavimobilis marinus]SFE88908.1 diaminopimelate epimerase [Flavimobilis marinus]